MNTRDLRKLAEIQDLVSLSSRVILAKFQETNPFHLSFVWLLRSRTEIKQNKTAATEKKRKKYKF